MAIDPRAYSEEKIEPPHPLPHVSRKALKRVKEPVPVPQMCRYCQGPVELVNHAEIYGREFNDWPYSYLCRPCDAFVGVHPNTDIPLGTLADADLRQARKTQKRHFLLLQHERGWTRKQAYQWLADQLGLPYECCHWGWFEVVECERAGLLCFNELQNIKRPGGPKWKR